MNRKIIFAFVAVSLSLCMLLSACGGAAGGTGTTAAAATAATTTAAASTTAVTTTAVVTTTAAAAGITSTAVSTTAGGALDVSQPVDMTAVATTGTTSKFPIPIVDKVFSGAGINVSWQLEPQADWNTKKGVLLASGQLPDIFFGTVLTDSDVSNGAFLDWAPYMDLAPNIRRFFDVVPAAKNMATSEGGEIWGIPNKLPMGPESADTLYICQTWLDTLGLSVPKTTDEFYNTLKAFVESDPNGNGQNDEIGYSGNGQATTNSAIWDAGKMAWVFPAFGVMMNHGETLCMVVDGEPVFGPTMEGYKEAMKYIHKLYSEGLWDNEYFTLDFATMAAKFRGDIYIGSASGWTMSNTLGPNTDKYTLMEPLIGPDGDQGWFSSDYAFKIYPNRAAISAACANPERAVYLFNLCYDEYTTAQLSFGSEGIGMGRDADGNPMFLDVPETHTDAEWRLENSMGTRVPGWTSDEFCATITGENDILEKYRFDIFYSKWFNRDVRYPYIKWNKTIQDELAILKTDIDSGVLQGMVDFVTNGDIDAKWDGYIEGLNRMGLERLMDIYREGLANYQP